MTFDIVTGRGDYLAIKHGSKNHFNFIVWWNFSETICKTLLKSEIEKSQSNLFHELNFFIEDLLGTFFEGYEIIKSFDELELEYERKIPTRLHKVGT